MEPQITVDFNFEGMAFIVLDYIFTKSVQSELCFTLRNSAHATYSDFFTAVKMTIFSRNLIFHIFAQNIDCGYSLEPPQLGGSNEYPQSLFLL